MSIVCCLQLTLHLLEIHMCVFAVTQCGIRSHNKLIYDWPHANVCINFHAKFMCSRTYIVQVLLCLCIRLLGLFFLVFVSSHSLKQRMPECVKYMRPVNVDDLCHIHIKPHIIVQFPSFFVAPVLITFHYVPDGSCASSMVV